MKSTGVIRRIDELGRIVVPKAMCRKLGIVSGDPLEIHIEEDRIVITKDSDACLFCGCVSRLSEYKGRMICQDCRDEISSI